MLLALSTSTNTDRGPEKRIFSGVASWGMNPPSSPSSQIRAFHFFTRGAEISSWKTWHFDTLTAACSVSAEASDATV